MPNDAEAAYKRVLGRDETDEDAQIALVQLYSVNERWQDLRALLEGKKARALDPEARLSLLYQIGDLDEGVLDDQPAATDAITSRSSRSIPARSARSARSSGSTRRARIGARSTSCLARRIPFAATGAEAAGTPESRAHLTFRRGELHANRLDDPQGAADLFEQALGDRARATKARARGSRRCMKRPELRQRIAKALEPLYREDEAWPKLALVLGAQREAAESGTRRRRCSSQLAELQEERLGRAAAGAGDVARGAAHRSGATRDPRQRRAAGDAARAAGGAGGGVGGGVPRLRAGDLALRGELLESAAELYEHELGDVDKARATWKRLLELDPTNLHTARPAAAALARLYEDGRGLARSSSTSCTGRRSGPTSADEKKELLLPHRPHRGGAARRSGGGDRRPIARSSTRIRRDLRALDALEKLHQAQGQWPELTDILKRRLELRPTRRTRRGAI